MIITKYDSQEEWLAARVGKITGSRLKDILIKRGTEHKKGFYELIAERLAIPRDDERPMDRGHRLEEESILRFEKETGKVVDKSLVIWMRDDNSNIAISPDGSLENDTEVVESKSLSSASHIEAYIKKEIPSEYEEQVIQYFIVNDKLTTLYFLFYDPSLMVKEFFYITVTRSEVQQRVDTYLEFQRKTLEEVERLVAELTF